MPLRAHGTLRAVRRRPARTALHCTALHASAVRCCAQVSGIVTEAVKDKFKSSERPADDEDDGLARLDPKKMTLQQMRDSKQVV